MCIRDRYELIREGLRHARLHQTLGTVLVIVGTWIPSCRERHRFRMGNDCWVQLGVPKCNTRVGGEQPLKRNEASHIQVTSIHRCWHYLLVGVRAWVGHHVPMVQLREQRRHSFKIRDVPCFNLTICLAVMATELLGVVSQPECLPEVRARDTRLFHRLPRT